jgi:hypothetical protein
MRKLSITVVAAAAILALNSMGCSANAVTASGSTLPNAAKNFSPIHETACRGWGRWCGPGYVRACGPYRCWCRPCW